MEGRADVDRLRVDAGRLRDHLADDIAWNAAANKPAKPGRDVSAWPSVQSGADVPAGLAMHAGYGARSRAADARDALSAGSALRSGADLLARMAVHAGSSSQSRATTSWIGAARLYELGALICERSRIR